MARDLRFFPPARTRSKQSSLLNRPHVILNVTMTFTELERYALSLLTDAHAHPTDDPRLSSSPPSSDDAGNQATFEEMAERLVSVPIGGICAMSSCTQDQDLVKRLVAAVERARRDAKGKGKEVEGGEAAPRVIPCFGEHGS